MADSPALGSSGITGVAVYSAGNPIKDTIRVVSVEVNKALNRIPTARIVMLDGDMPNQDFPVSNTEDFKPGTEIKIAAGYDQNEETIFQGVIVKHGIKISGDNFARLEIECQDKAVKMAVGRKNANYVDKTDNAIITTLIGNHSGLSSEVGTTSTTHKELVQYYCTDWDFMLSRAEATGMVVLVEDAKVTVKAPDTSASAVLSVAYGEDLIAFEADIDARTQISAAQGTSWDLSNQAIVQASGQAPSLNTQGNLDTSTLAQVIGLDTFALQTSAPQESTALKDWASGYQLKAGLARIIGSMTFQGSAKAKVGCAIELKGVGKRFNGTVYVTAVRHVIEEGYWLTEASFGLAPDWFADRRDLTAPSAAGLLPGVDGLQIGTVLKLDGDPESQNRIQVSVPVLQAETEGVWARLATFYASNAFGAFFIPEVGDEVVLGYANGDPSHPVILGSLYSSKQAPPNTLTAENNLKTLLTKSKLKLEFDEEKKIITLETPGANKVVISDDAKSILLQDQNSNKVELADGGITLDTPKDIKLTAKGNVTISGDGGVTVTSKADVKIEGMNTNIEAKTGFVGKGNGTAELSASGQTTIKGGMVKIN